jgi:putative hydrolase of the HAD superfamily
VAPAYRGILFDLFGTLISFEPTRLPEIEIDGKRMRTTVGMLEALLAEWVPGTTPGDFLQAVLSVSEEMALARAEQHIELPSRERFRRALERVGCDDATQAEAAVHLSRAHMAAIAAATVFPRAHADLLAALRADYRFGVVTNFDDTGTAYDILRRHGIASLVEAVIVSEAVGLRKPHPALVRAALRGLGLRSDEVLFVGDTFAEDIAGAHALGIDAAWIDAKGAGVPAGATPPRYVLRTLPELAAALQR